MKRGLFQLLSANVVYLLISILNSFLLPKFLSVETYAIIKTYTLYIGYAGFLSLGYADGMYLKYGGENIENINSQELSSNFKSYFLLEIFVSMICLFAGFLLNDFVFVSFSLGSLCINIIGYYKNLYQAVGEFKSYGKALNYQTILMFVSNMVLLFLMRTDNSTYYIVIQVVTAFVVMIYLTFILNMKTSFLRGGSISFKQIWSNVSSGFTLMLGNFSSSIFTSLDRWFIKILMDSTSFAYYSFAVSLENIVNVFVTPITISLYNVFCNKKDVVYVKKIKKMVMLYGSIVIAAAFPVKFIVMNSLTEYIDSLTIIFPLIGAQLFYAIIKGIHVNMYKVEKKQRKYFITMMVMIIVALITNVVLYLILKTTDSFAYATFITAIVWFLYCEAEVRELRFSKKEYMTIFCIVGGYFIAGYLSNPIIGLACYCAIVIIAVIIFMRETYRNVLEIVSMVLKRKRL